MINGRRLERRLHRGTTAGLLVPEKDLQEFLEKRRGQALQARGRASHRALSANYLHGEVKTGWPDPILKQGWRRRDKLPG